MPSIADTPSAHPYEQLTPDVVLDALASVGLYGDGRLTALGSYENRVYQVFLDDGERVVAKFYRPGRWSAAQIGEEHAFSAQLEAAEIPAVGPLTLQGATLHQHAGFAFSVSPWRGGRQPELDDFEVLEWIGRFLARIHTVGASQPFVTRPQLNLQSFGQDSLDWLLAQQMIPLEAETAWRTACEQALTLIAGRASSKNEMRPFGLEDATHIRLHGDCHPGNILWTPVDEAAGTGGPHFVDLDDARMGPAVQDLWMLLSGDRRQRTQQLGALLDGYEQFRTFDRRELVLIEPLRTLRLIHYSAWLARRWEDPIFAINFPWFGSPDYWRGQTDMLIEQIEAMQEAPLVA
nr:serine/threonine protein kinase [Pantoea sp. 18069]